MQADFLDAHDRHWNDAETLFLQGRYANSSHLYGVSAECGLKGLMVKFGMPISANGSPSQSDDRVHGNKLWARYEHYRSGFINGVLYSAQIAQHFQAWDIQDRYANQSGFNQAGVQSHRNGAEAVCQLIAKAQRNGLL